MVYLEEYVNRIEILEVDNGFIVQGSDKVVVCTTIEEAMVSLLNYYKPERERSITFERKDGIWREM